MAKKQKVWLTIFILMFVIPEILWSPALNFIYEFFQKSNSVHQIRPNFLANTDNANIYSSILFIQFIGLLFTTISLFIVNLKSKRVLLWILDSGLLILTIISFFIFGFSVSLRHIGF